MNADAAASAAHSGSDCPSRIPGTCRNRPVKPVIRKGWVSEAARRTGRGCKGRDWLVYVCVLAGRTIMTERPT